MEMDIRDLYQRLFKVANRFLEIAGTFSIGELRDHDPSVGELARSATMLAKVMNELADDEYSEERIAINAAQAALFMRQVAIAVRKQDEKLLEKAISDLENVEFV